LLGLDIDADSREILGGLPTRGTFARIRADRNAAILAQYLASHPTRLQSLV
jgi:hypothetical protein